jgi:hypothetical protein
MLSTNVMIIFNKTNLFFKKQVVET